MMLYMVVTADKYELPLLVSHDIKEAAKFGGVTPSTVCGSVSRKCSGKRKGFKYIRIKVDDV